METSSLKVSSAAPLTSSWHFSLVRSYAPSPELDWLNLQFDQSHSFAWASFVDPRVEDEFARFANRDYIGLVTAIGFGIAFIAWPILFPGQFTDVYQDACYAAGAVAIVTACVCAFLTLNGPFTVYKAKVREHLSEVLALSCCFGCSVCDVADFYPRCVKARNILAPVLSSSTVSDSHYVQDCNRVVAAYPVVALTVAVALASLAPPSAVIIGVLNFIVFYVGYAETESNLWTTGETGKELTLKAIVYAFTFLAAVTMVALRRGHTRRQFISAAMAHRQYLLTVKRSQEVDGMLSAMVPESALERLICNEQVEDYTPDATVLFSDMVSFTAWSSVRSTAVVVGMLNTLCIELDRTAREMGVEKVKTIGDAYWAVTGLPTAMVNHANTMVHFALEMHKIVKRKTAGRADWGLVRLRVGVNSGPLRGGIFGTSRLSYEVFGETSDMAEECEKNGAPEQVCISDATRARLFDESRYVLEPHKTIEGHASYLIRLSRPGAASEPSNDSFSPMSPKAAQSSIRDREAQMEQRRRFIAQRAAKNAENLEDAEVVEAHISRRRWNWVLMAFDDDEQEAAYQAFIHDQNQSMQRATRILTVVFVTLQLIIAGADQASTVGAASWSVLAVTAVTSCAVIALQYTATRWLSWLDALFGVVMLLDAVGCGLGQDSIISNDTTYVVSVFFALVVNGVNALPAAVKCALMFVCGVVPTIAFSYDSLLFNSVAGFMVFGLFIATLADVTIEVMFRRQFVESRVQEYNHRAQLAREAEQRALLEAIVPTHVITRLQAWLSDGMDIEQTIAQVYDHVAVGFLSVHQHEPASPIPTPDHGDPDAWLFAAHVRIDAAISLFSDGLFDKIKTIGDKVMIAGSFRSSQDAAAASRAMMRTVHALCVDGSLSVLSGFHVGEVMGAVLGTERLCFDIFGDTVNTASRVLSTLEAGEVCGVSDAFFAEAFDGDATSIAGCVASAEKERSAKGKGTIKVFSIAFRPDPAAELRRGSSIELRVEKMQRLSSFNSQRPSRRPSSINASALFISGSMTM